MAFPGLLETSRCRPLYQYFTIYVPITLTVMVPKFMQVNLHSGRGRAYMKGGLYSGCELGYIFGDMLIFKFCKLKVSNMFLFWKRKQIFGFYGRLSEEKYLISGNFTLSFYEHFMDKTFDKP